MMTRYRQISSMDELREYVLETLCEHHQIQPNAFPMTECVLRRRGRPCGVFFCLYGPRLTKCTAIWETERNQILFYDARGERFLKTQLLESPRLEFATPAEVA